MSVMPKELPNLISSTEVFNDYINYLKTNSEEFMIDFYDESPLINGWEGNIMSKYWFTFTDMEKKDHLDRELVRYFNGEDEVDLSANEG